MKKIWLKTVTALCLSTVAFAAFAYETPTHRDISEIAVSASQIADGIKFKRMAIADFDGLPLQRTNTQFLDSNGQLRTVVDLFQFGAEWEDDFEKLNGARHFIGGTKMLGQEFPPSPDWIIGDGAGSNYAFTWKKARSDFFMASTEADKSIRKKYWGLTFQKVGHAIHHIQDMAQPQHARNDLHCDSIACTLPGIYAPSHYEKWTERNGSIVKFFMTANYPPVYESTSSSQLSGLRDFWQNGGKGMADFSNRNFVSAGTNFIGTPTSFGNRPGFPSPVIKDFHTETIASLQGHPAIGDISKFNQICAGNLQTCVIEFASTQVDDQLNTTFADAGNPSNVNNRASSYSIFDQYMRLNQATVFDPVDGTQWRTSRIFALNRFNFYSGYPFLMKRAVMYSAGMINYFFRGEMDMVRSKFSPYQVIIKNKGPDAMQGAFSLYYDDAAGTRYPVPGATWVLSIASNGESAPLDVNLNVSPVPAANKYVLVFKGTMGNEVDMAVAVNEVTLAPPVEGLYVLATDTSNKRVVLRVNKYGTTTVASTEFNPFFSDNVALGPVRKYLQKQVSFFTLPSGESTYRLQSLSTGNGGFIRHTIISEDQKVDTSLSGVPLRWIAKPELTGSSDTYLFSLSESGRLNWERHRRLANGADDVSNSYIDLPTDFGDGEINYYGLRQNGALVSPDGLNVYGFQAADNSLTPPDYGYQLLKLVITLGETPSASFVADGTSFSALKVLQSEPYQSTPTRTLTVQIPACGSDPGGPASIPLNRVTQKLVRQYQISVPGYIGFLDGKLERFSSNYVRNEVASVDSESGWATYSHDCTSPPWIRYSANLHAEETYESVARVSLSGGVAERTCKGAGAYLNEVGADHANMCSSERIQLSGGSPGDYRALQDYDGPDADRPDVQLSPINVRSPDTMDLISYASPSTLFYFRFPTANPGDTFVLRRSNNVNSEKELFRGQEVPSTATIETSPFGEVFFATRDLSQIIQDMGKSNLPRIVIPPNIKSIEAALWL